MFIDHVKIYVKAGDGGNGCVAFHREKYVAKGGPSGGDGGKGANIVLVVDTGDNTLLKYKYKRKFVAQNGGDGKPGKFHGATAEDLILPVPPGTVVKDPETDLVIKDMSEPGERFVLCKGGRGGWGNQHFATPTRQIPRFAKNGTKGQEREVILELKMLADVGLVGLPNVGKSSILSRISEAKPKIANYHFTTLSPNLGVVKTGEGQGFVVADIPGLIEGASEGAGLGHEFLRHVDRCRLILHVVDISCAEGRDPIDDIELINNELSQYSCELASRRQIIIANKADAIGEEFDKAKFEKYVEDNGWLLLYVSAVTGDNLDELVKLVDRMLQQLPEMTRYESEFSVDEVVTASDDRSVEITKEDGVFVVEAEWLFNLMGSVNFSDRESLMYFQRVLKNNKVIDALEEAGCVDGDTVSIYDFEFDFVK